MQELQAITNHPVYKQVLADSFGGVLYNVANRGKYDSAELIRMWDNLPPAVQSSAGGITKGAMHFLKEDE